MDDLAILANWDIFSNQPGWKFVAWKQRSMGYLLVHLRIVTVWYSTNMSSTNPKCTRNGWQSSPNSWFTILLPTHEFHIRHQPRFCWSSTRKMLWPQGELLRSFKLSFTSGFVWKQSHYAQVWCLKHVENLMVFPSRKRCHFWRFTLDIPTSQHPQPPQPPPTAPQWRCCGDTSDPPPLPPVAESGESIASAPGCVHPQRTPGRKWTWYVWSHPPAIVQFGDLPARFDDTGRYGKRSKESKYTSKLEKISRVHIKEPEQAWSSRVWNHIFGTIQWRCLIWTGDGITYLQMIQIHLDLEKGSRLPRVLR